MSSRRTVFFVVAAAAIATAVAAPHLFLPAPPMLSREGRIGALLLFGSLEALVFWLLWRSIMMLPRRWPDSRLLLAGAAFAVVAAAAAAWADEAAFALAFFLCRAITACTASGLGDGVIHALSIAVRPFLAGMLVPACVLVALAGWERRRT